MEKKEFFLESASGFMMPFTTEGDVPVESMLGYGEQTHPISGERFHHCGVDYVCPHRPLYALATGTVIAVGEEGRYERFITIRYGRYEVRYGHVSNVCVPYGTPVVAAQQVATSGDFLHMDVRLDGEEIDPGELISVLYANISTLESLGMPSSQFVTFDIPVSTPYDKDKEEIIALMERWLPAYFDALRTGEYACSPRMESSLRNQFRQGADRGYFFDEFPNYANPLGLSARSGAIIGKVQSLIIEDFLTYLSSRGIHVSTWSPEEKKNLIPPTVPAMETP